MENRSEIIRKATEASKARYEWLVKRDRFDIIALPALVTVFIVLYTL